MDGHRYTLGSLTRRAGLTAAAFAALVLGFGAVAPVVAEDNEDIWPTLKGDIFGDKVVSDAQDALVLDAPYRAEDAALVPLTIKLGAGLASAAKKLTLVIDKNPAPVAAEFTFGPAAGGGERTISTRVRIDMYSNVRAIVETADGKLLMAAKFVKAAGGCSAPALKDTDAALAEAGKMQIKFLDAANAQTHEGEIKIRHPQYSGLQLNQATGFYIPSKFLRTIEVTRGQDLVFRVEGGISLSENPSIRFTYAPGQDETLVVTAQDTDGKTFTGRGAPNGS